MTDNVDEQIFAIVGNGADCDAVMAIINDLLRDAQAENERLREKNENLRANTVAAVRRLDDAREGRNTAERALDAARRHAERAIGQLIAEGSSRLAEVERERDKWKGYRLCLQHGAGPDDRSYGDLTCVRCLVNRAHAAETRLAEVQLDRNHWNIAYSQAKIRTTAAEARLEAVRPNPDDEPQLRAVTHSLSECLNDNAPIGEQQYEWVARAALAALAALDAEVTDR